MSTTENTFSDQVFTYIMSEYGKQTLKNVQTDKNKSVVIKVLNSSSRQNDTVEHTGNKIIAMLRMNP